MLCEVTPFVGNASGLTGLHVPPLLRLRQNERRPPAGCGRTPKAGAAPDSGLRHPRRAAGWGEGIRGAVGCGCEALLPSASCTLVHGGRSLTSAGAWVQGRMSVTGGCVPASMLTSAVSSSSTTPPPAGVCTGTVQLVQGASMQSSACEEAGKRMQVTRMFS